MQEQTRRVGNVPRLQSSIGSNQVGVFANPVNTYVEPRNNQGMLAIGDALGKLVPGVTEAFNNVLEKQAQADYAKGYMAGNLGDQPNPEASGSEFAGYSKARAIKHGLELSQSIEQEAAQIRPEDSKTWGDYKSPIDALQGLISARVHEATAGIDPQYAIYTAAAIDRITPSLFDTKHKEIRDYTVGNLTDSVASIAQTHLQEFVKNNPLSMEVRNYDPAQLRKLYDQHLTLLTQDGLINKKQASEFLGNVWGDVAVQQKIPELLNFMDYKDESGISIGMTSAGDRLRAGQAAAITERKKILSAETADSKAMYREQAARGQFTMEMANNIVNDPVASTYWTNDELENLLYTSRVAGLQEETKVVNTDALHAGQGWLIPDGSDKNKATDLYMEQLAETASVTSGDPSEGLKAQLKGLNINGAMVYDKFKSVINNGAAIIPDDKNAQAAEGFKAGVSLFNQMMQMNPALAFRHATSKDARDNILRFNAATAAGKTDEEAWAWVKQIANKPIMEQEVFFKSDLPGKIRETVDGHFKQGFWDKAFNGEGVDNGGARYDVVMKMAMHYGELGLSPDKALEASLGFFEANYVNVRGTSVYTGGTQLPEDFEKFSDWYIETKLKKDPEKYYVVPTNTKGAYAIMGDFGWTSDPLFVFNDAYKEFTLKDAPTVDQFNQLQQDRATQKIEYMKRLDAVESKAKELEQQRMNRAPTTPFSIVQ
jgi:hypothetical protein